MRCFPPFVLLTASLEPGGPRLLGLDRLQQGRLRQDLVVRDLPLLVLVLFVRGCELRQRILVDLLVVSLDTVLLLVLVLEGRQGGPCGRPEVLLVLVLEGRQGGPVSASVCVDLVSSEAICASDRELWRAHICLHYCILHALQYICAHV